MWLSPKGQSRASGQEGLPWVRAVLGLRLSLRCPPVLALQFPAGLCLPCAASGCHFLACWGARPPEMALAVCSVGLEAPLVDSVLSSRDPASLPGLLWPFGFPSQRRDVRGGPRLLPSRQGLDGKGIK